ncbi:tRNA (adenosine(37)-N6)-threonylcarbamoyltransferase complex transferase subunit TsaD [Latilactobacillus curvatus]|jgi:N6-L-threonylcarbamoyladenine synthase|uniref:tRNA N6-adenosine threonylcarbamoyltransferase n=1 Tax=Latilactobacillus curvatus JCM 1096 = DSM 20019 TaxID=1293592 RepID=A0AAJ0LF02_LATCU|nr:tRNA (adenosine(37)-N6)-threonylcarbamoyltransferase complex transferase subunit TsaD [Latilactobacillus curvatus]AWV72287.1 tRNA (adenosine(37)-N6)-threonylcarbamoyltransferase complex transferase subunit TsaD [Latilactobacillus curvatus]AZP97046.1 tRNA (adenosine(37)-N6)-threonylcarbamoyltransferase complex transferase subunit TsaD [Latilactobacillus curvatus]EHE86071.1 metalloendopeptidase, glycoprotease family protein [Latilactobacillus curvatus CRL 705]KRK92712.1 metalloendopeptidase, g
MSEKRELILAFESSCDETSVAVIEDGHVILSNIIATQIKSHQRFGGVVPEVASRHHVEQITVCTQAALEEAGVTYADLTAVAVTYGPGLVGALLIGVTAAKAIAYAHHLPLIPVNHMAGHIYAARFVKPLEYPLLALLVSGGHTELVYMPAAGEFEIIGDTRDDAAGEAYDKIGRVLGIQYPAGKEIDRLAHLGQDTFKFPRAMLKEDNLDFSFSGLKSAFINTVHHADQIGETLNHEDLAASFQASVVEVLTTKTMHAARQLNVRQLVVAGGVAANQGLREGLATAIKASGMDLDLIMPPLRLCGDNGAMIGAAAHIELQKQQFADLSLNAVPGLDFPYGA